MVVDSHQRENPGPDRLLRLCDVIDITAVMSGGTSLRARARLARRVAAVFCAGCLGLTVWASSPAGAEESAEESWLVAAFALELNLERAARDLPPLLYSGDMSVGADSWAETMDARNDLRHSTGTIEIIGYGPTTGSITNAWMRSPSHRHLITDPNLTVAGIGVSCESSSRMWVAVQFRRADESKATQTSSSASPRVTASGTGGRCGSEPSPELIAAVDVDPMRRLYLAYFGREPDVAGLGYWSSVVGDGVRLEDVSDLFSGSREFTVTYGSLSDAEFVDLVYRNVLGRLPDGDGNRYWVSRLRNGVTRGELMVGFSESAEFRNKTR